MKEIYNTRGLRFSLIYIYVLYLNIICKNIFCECDIDKKFLKIKKKFFE